MDYGEVLTGAWRIIWRFKILWIFGILAGCSSTGGSSNFRMEQSFNINSPGAPDRLLGLFQRVPIWVWVLLVAALLVIFLIGILLKTIGQIGLVQGVIQADEGAQGLSFGPLFSSSFRFFWRVFLLDLVVGLALAAIIIVFVIGAVVAGLTLKAFALLCLVPLACILIPVMAVLAWLVNIVLEQSVIAIISENAGILDGLRLGWRVVRRNIGTFIVMGLILLFGGGIASLIIGIPMALIVVPPVLGVLSGVRSATLIGIGIAVVLFIIYLPILLAATGILRSYIAAAWTLTFRRLTGLAGTPSVEVIPPVEPASPQG